MAPPPVQQPLHRRYPITIVIDTPCWFDPHGARLASGLNALGATASVVRSAEQAPESGISLLLSCMRIVPPDVLARQVQTIVVHASALPHGRGFSPLVWHVLEGRKDIPVTMIAAAASVDSGPILMRETLQFEGHELNGEMRAALAEATMRMCVDYLSRETLSKGEEQAGEASWYRRRRPADSELDPNKTIAEQFDLLRTVDHERYPAFFEHRGHRYTLRIERA